MEHRGAVRVAESIDQGPLGAPGETRALGCQGCWHSHGQARELFPGLGDVPRAVRRPWPAGALPSGPRLAPGGAGPPGAGWAPHGCCRCQAVFAGGKRRANGAAHVGLQGGDIGDFSIYPASRVKALCSWVCRCSKAITRRQDARSKLGWHKKAPGTSHKPEGG